MKTSQNGFTLIEVLIALVILAIGLLGMSSLMMTSMQSSQSAYLRSQASLLAYDITERMRANFEEATGDDDSYVLTAATETVTDPGCDSGGCSESQQAQLDLHEWRAAAVATIPGAFTSISRTNKNEYVITISWEESSALTQNTANSSFELRVNL